MIIKNGNIITPDGILQNTDLRIEKGHITEIGKDLGGDGKVYYADNMYVGPGYVDIHTHGGHGSDFMDDNPDSIDNILDFHTKNGTTSLLASTVTAPVEQIVGMVERVREYMKTPKGKTHIMGVHIEGPYISYKNKGAQKEEFLRVPARDDYSFILDNNDVIKNVTIATELDGAEKMTQDMRNAGIVVSCGHDDGKSETAYPVIEAGASNLTHWYCAMSTARVEDGKRSAGLMEIGLTDDRLTLELLADGHHLPPELVRMAYKAKGAKKLCLVSDCLRAGGMPRDGRVYTLGTEGDEEATKFIVSNGVARLTDGTRFAGSIQPVSQMVRNIVNDCEVPLVDAVRMASLTPAEIIGEDERIGSISVGKVADINILNEELYPVKTMIDGEFVN